MTKNKTFLKDNLLEIHIFIILYYILYYITLKYKLFSYSFLLYSSLFNNKILTILSQTMTHPHHPILVDCSFEISLHKSFLNFFTVKGSACDALIICVNRSGLVWLKSRLHARRVSETRSCCI